MPTAYSLPALATGSPTPDPRISDARVVFRLSYGQATLSISEPIGWDSADWTLKRDEQFHGFNFEFSGDESTLTFWKASNGAAFDFLENIYHTAGPSATVLLLWKLADDSGELPLQTLLLSFAKRQVQTDGENSELLTLTGSRYSLHPDIRTHWDTILSMDARTALATDPVTGTGTIPLSPPAPVTLVLHAQRIRQSLLSESKDPVDTDWQSFDNIGGSILQGGDGPLGGIGGTKAYSGFYINMPLNAGKASPSEIETFSGNEGQPTISTDAPPPVLTTKVEGSYHIELTVDYQVAARLQRRSVSISPPVILDYRLVTVLIAGGVTYNITAPVSRTVGKREMDPARVTGTLSIDIDLPAGAPVQVYGFLSITPPTGPTGRAPTCGCSISARSSLLPPTPLPRPPPRPPTPRWTC